MFKPFESEEKRNKAVLFGIVVGIGLALACWALSALLPYSFAEIGGIVSISALTALVVSTAFVKPGKQTPTKYVVSVISGMYLASYLLLLVLIRLLWGPRVF